MTGKTLGSTQRLLILGAALGLVLLAPAPTLGQKRVLHDRITPVVEASNRVSPSVVNISTEQAVATRRNPFYGDSLIDRFFRDFTMPQHYTRRSLGSGVIVDSRGYVLTNEHVLLQASKVTVGFLDERTYEAEIIGADPQMDLAVLKIKGDGDFPAVELGNSQDLMIGETVIAIGNPFGLSHTVTTGVISALHRTVKVDEKAYKDFIQTDASINPGNSGGPLLNINGQLIGINTAIYGKAEGIGFAIPMNRARGIMNDLMAFGEVRRAWLGLQVQDLTGDLIQVLGLQSAKGVVVSHVYADAPADKAGLQRGDVITAVGGIRITDRTEYYQVLDGYTAGSKLALEITRDETTLEIKLDAIEFPRQILPDEIWRRIGVELISNSRKIANHFGLYTSEGMVVSRVKQGSPAGRIGLRGGDVILRIDRFNVSAAEAFEDAILKAMRRGSAIFLIQRDASLYYVTMVF